MTYHLYIGDRTFSSWSLRGWLMLEKFGLPFKTTMVGLYSGTMAAELAHLPGAKTVPVMVTAQGGILTDSLAIGETLVEENPDINLLPRDPKARAMARSIIAEMHSGFGPLRDACQHNIAHVLEGFVASEAVLKDVTRIDELWQRARAEYGANGPWLFGEYSLADAVYAPIANRFTTYGLAVSAVAQAYIDATISDGPMRRWRAMGQTVRYDPFPYDMGLPTRPWPGERLAAVAVDAGPSENDTCTYSGDPVTHFMALEGRTFGFCNAFCRDKTVADPSAWPKFMALLRS